MLPLKEMSHITIGLYRHQHLLAGVYLNKRSRTRPWYAQISIDNKVEYLASYATEEEAARAYDEAAKLYHGPKARLNFPESSASGCGGGQHKEAEEMDEDESFDNGKARPAASSSSRHPSTKAMKPTAPPAKTTTTTEPMVSKNKQRSRYRGGFGKVSTMRLAGSSSMAHLGAMVIGRGIIRRGIQRPLESPDLCWREANAPGLFRY